MARASAAAAVAAGVVEPPEVDPDLRSISPISTSGASRLVGRWGGRKRQAPTFLYRNLLGTSKDIYIYYIQ